MTWPDDEPTPAELYAQYDASVASEALGRLMDVRDQEEQITSDVLAATPTHGLEFRMKSPSSLARKIATKAADFDASTVADTSARLQDLVRYTALVDDHDDLVKEARSTVKTMRARGYEVIEVESSYVDGNPYKGLHTIMRSPNGLEFELQVHSKVSQDVKDQLHINYEISRDTTRPWDERTAAAQQNRELAARLPSPRGIDRLRTLGGCTVTTKTYPTMG